MCSYAPCCRRVCERAGGSITAVPYEHRRHRPWSKAVSQGNTMTGPTEQFQGQETECFVSCNAYLPCVCNLQPHTRMSMAHYRERQVQRRVQKTIVSGNQPAQDDVAMNADTTATCQARNARTHVPKERQDQPDRTEDAIHNQPCEYGY
jgi:hypothetical protein